MHSGLLTCLSTMLACGYAPVVPNVYKTSTPQIFEYAANDDPRDIETLAQEVQDINLHLGCDHLGLTRSIALDATRSWVDFRLTVDGGTSAGDCENCTGPYGGINQVATVSQASGVPVSQSHWESVVVHELGHAMGLAHTNEPTDVMYATAPGSISDAAWDRYAYSLKDMCP